MAAFNNVIQWYESSALDKPELRSPTPCPRGVYCQYKLPNKETNELELACCRMVHPGEEGNGRRLFPARTAPDGRQQPACVRLTGKADFYERCRMKQPWRVWATEHEIPLPPADIPWVQVVRGPIQRDPKKSAIAHSQKEGGVRSSSAAASSMTEWPCLQDRAGLTRVIPPPSLNLSMAAMGGALEAPSPGLPYGPPPRLDFSRSPMPTYGAGDCAPGDDFREPPQIRRLRTERLYEDDGSATPSLPYFPTRADRIQERVQAFCNRGAIFEDALQAAMNEIDAEITRERNEGAMEGID